MTTADLLARAASDLAPKLSGKDLVSTDAPQRWSSYHAPRPAAVVNVQTEEDVAETVKYCTSNNIPFLAQNGGYGWAKTFNLGDNGVLINLAALNSVTFNDDKTRATIGGGSSIKNTIDKAYAAGAMVMTGNCNHVGTLGAMLAGGYGNLMGVSGFGVDTIVSLRVVTADGQLRTVTESSDPDLFWGLRGAAPNLGIVTSAEVKSAPVTNENDTLAFSGAVIFSPDKLERVVEAVQNLELKPRMNIYIYCLSGGPPDNAPIFFVTPFLYQGTVEEGHEAFSSIYDIGPLVDSTGVVPYNQWNTGGDPFCDKGGYKPSYSVAFQTLKPDVWRQVWDKFIAFQGNPGAGRTSILMEAFSLTNARQNPTSASFPNRHINFNAVVIPWYDDESLHGAAEAFGRGVRDLLRSSDDLEKRTTYVNFAHGDEDLNELYGDSLERLQDVKKRYDPENRFNQWFTIK